MLSIIIVLIVTGHLEARSKPYKRIVRLNMKTIEIIYIRYSLIKAFNYFLFT